MTEKKNGRPLKVTKRRTEAFCEAISVGSTNEMAAAYARIDPDTALNWLERGRIEIERRAKDEKPNENEDAFVEFFGAVRQARLEAGLRWQMIVNTAAERDAAWAYKMLRTRFPKDYQDVNQTEISGPEGGPVVLNFGQWPE